jgi:hypothetical protein
VQRVPALVQRLLVLAPRVLALAARVLALARVARVLGLELRRAPPWFPS